MHILAVAFVLVPAAFQLLPAKPAVQHVTLVSSVTGSGAALTLHLAVTPKPNIHVYGPGAKDFLQPSLKIVTAGVVAGDVSFPRPEIVRDPILKELIPMYTKMFRVEQPVKLLAALSSGKTMTVSGVFSYQACDNTMCYAPSTVPVSWNVR
jgi:hypothetical protein